MIAPATMSSCNIKIVPAKNAAILVEVQEIADDASSLYDRIIVSNDKRFVTYASDYQALVDKVKLLTDKDKTRNKAGTLVSQDAKIQSQLEEYRKAHSDKGAITNAEAKVFKAYLKSFIRPRIVTELSL